MTERTGGRRGSLGSRLIVDRARCAGHGRSESPEPLHDVVPAEPAPNARNAPANCPAGSLDVEEVPQP